MTGNGHLRWLVAAVSFVLLFATASPVYADDDWRSPNCATGETTDHLVERDANGADTIRLDGWSVRCGPHLEPVVYQFGLILYTNDGAWIGALTDYHPGTSPTPFTYLVDDTISTEELGGPLTALCLAYAPANRLSCVSVNRIGSDQPPTISTLSTGSHLVTRIPDPGSRCPSCVRE